MKIRPWLQVGCTSMIIISNSNISRITHRPMGWAACTAITSSTSNTMIKPRDIQAECKILINMTRIPTQMVSLHTEYQPDLNKAQVWTDSMAIITMVELLRIITMLSIHIRKHQVSCLPSMLVRHNQVTHSVRVQAGLPGSLVRRTMQRSQTICSSDRHRRNRLVRLPNSQEVLACTPRRLRGPRMPFSQIHPCQRVLRIDQDRRWEELSPTRRIHPI
mmetsp:Transcript_16749/g.29334  ORF Transcript_16749/g.29334 Transcript_16749/m.29334 type:complete len:218 (+) Transcript_16749:554-1207(+)